MSEIIDGGYCYENIRRNAYWYNAHLDTTFRPDVDFADTLKTEDLPTIQSDISVLVLLRIPLMHLLIIW